MGDANRVITVGTLDLDFFHGRRRRQRAGGCQLMRRRSNGRASADRRGYVQFIGCDRRRLHDIDDIVESCAADKHSVETAAAIESVHRSIVTNIKNQQVITNATGQRVSRRSAN